MKDFTTCASYDTYNVCYKNIFPKLNMGNYAEIRHNSKKKKNKVKNWVVFPAIITTKNWVECTIELQHNDGGFFFFAKSYYYISIF